MIRTIRTGLVAIVSVLVWLPPFVAPRAEQAVAPKLAAAIVDVNRLFEAYMAERHVPGDVSTRQKVSDSPAQFARADDRNGVHS